LPDLTQQRIRADWETQLGSEPGASFTAQCKPDGFQALLLPDRPSTIYSGYLIQTFGKYLSSAVAIGAIELASGDPPVNLLTSPKANPPESGYIGYVRRLDSCWHRGIEQRLSTYQHRQ
jgi:hypothetical protein